MTYQAHSNFVEAYISGPDGDFYSLQGLARGSKSPSDLRSPEYVQFIDSVSINISVFRFTEINISLTPTFEEATNLIRSGRLGLGFSTEDKAGGSQIGESAISAASKIKFNTIVVRLHTDKRSSNWFKGFLLVPELSVSQEKIEIQLKATGLLNFTRQRATNEAIAGTKTYREVLYGLAQDKGNVGYRVEIESDDSVAQEFFNRQFNGNIAKKDWEAIRDILTQGNMNLIDAGTEDATGAVVIKVASRDYARKRLSQCTLVAFENIDPTNGRFPILDMKTSLVNYAAGQALKSIANSISDQDKSQQKTDEDALVGPQTTKNYTDGIVTSDGSMPGESWDGSLGPKRSVPMDRDGNNDYIKKLSGYWQSLMDTAMSYEVTTLGIPGALPGQPVNISVAGTEFISGTFDCYEVTHNWTNGGAETTFQLYQTFGLASRIDEAIGKVESNTETNSDTNTVSPTVIGTTG